MKTFFYQDSTHLPTLENQRVGVNFINVLRAAFTQPDPKSAKNTIKLSVFFALLGSACIKTAQKMLMKLTLGSCSKKVPTALKMLKNAV